MSIKRRFVNSDNLMVAPVSFAKGDTVPAHRHENEQMTYVLTGALDEQDEVVVVNAGEVLIIPSDVLHAAVALEDTFELDIFNPPRADWIEGADSYLRK
jgi:quercetin dioxygenase-like cupin family protein